MPLIHKDLAGLYNGVSQQSPPLRLPTQVAEQINMVSSVVDGVSRRPGTRFIKSLPGSAVNQNSHSFPFRDSNGDKYIVFITDSATEPIEVYRPDGVKCQIQYEGAAKDYLLAGASAPSERFRVASIGDYMMVVNRDVTCEMDESKRSPQPPPYALYWIMRGVENTYYRLGAAEIKVKGDSVSTVGEITDTVAKHMVTNVPGCVQLEARGSVCRITGDGVGELACSDSYGDQATKLIKGKTAKTEDLPPHALDGDVVEITGGKGDQLGNYYLKYSKAENVWQECVKPGLCNEMKVSTLPHCLIRTATNLFLFRAAAKNETYEGYVERKVGDEDSAPNPSFIGQTIRDVYYFKNRLGFICGQTEVLSRPNDYFNFWPETSTEQLDNDPTDMAVGFNETVRLNWAVPFSENLLLFTDDKQFVLTSGGEVFTPTGCMIDLTTSFPCSAKARPINLANSLMFCSTSGKWSHVREYFIQPDTLANDAADLTAHCPNYLPADITRMLPIAAADTVLCWSPMKLNELYVYQYYWSGQEKPQSAWSRFVFAWDIVGMEYFGDAIYFFIRDNHGEIQIISMDMSKDLIQYHLDRMANPRATNYDPVTDRTVITYPYRYLASKCLSVFQITDDGLFRQDATVESFSETGMTLIGDWSDIKSVFIGESFDSSLELGEFVLALDGKVGELDGRLQIKTVSVLLAKSGPFMVKVNAPRRQEIIHRYSGAIIGESRFSLASLTNDTKRFPVQSQSKGLSVSIVSASALPLTIQGASWEGMYFSRSQKV